MKILQKIILILHLNKRWVRWMLSLSTFAIFAILTFPVQNKIYKSNDLMSVTADTIVNNNNDFGDNKSLERSDTVFIYKQKQDINTIEEKKPFDWKGILMWSIGFINGLIVLVLNIKKLFFKSN